MLSEKGWPLSIQVHTEWSKWQSNEHVVAGWALVRCCLIQWWVGGYWWLVGCRWVFGHFYLCPTSLKRKSEFPGIDVTNCLMGWDSRIFCLEKVLCIAVERMFDLFLFGLKMYLNFTGCPSLLFRSNSLNLRKSDCQRVCLFFVAFKCGVLWNKAFLMVKNPLRRAHFLGAFQGWGAGFKWTCSRHLEANPTPALGDDVLGQQLSACFVSDASHERRWSLAEVSQCYMVLFWDFLIIFVPRSDCAGRKGKGQSQIVAYFFSMEWFDSHWCPCKSWQNKDCYSWQLVPTSFEVDILKEWIGSCRWMVFLVIVLCWVWIGDYST